MKISASIYSGKDKTLPELVKELDQYGVDYFHIDCLDDPSVFDDIRKIRNISETPLDLHLITSNPEMYFDSIREERVEKVTFQYENLNGSVTFPKFRDSQLGLSIVSNTSVDVFEKFTGDFDFMLLMTTEPGKSGGRFNESNFQKIREFKRKFPKKRLHVDGGINDEVSFVLRSMGVDLIVSGSFLVNAPSVKAALLELRHQRSASRFKIQDFMHGLEETPILNINHLNLETILQKIDDYNLGFTLLTDNQNKLAGIITNADVRKGLLRNIRNLVSPEISDFINTNPVFVNQKRTIAELLKIIKLQALPILYLPVVDDLNRVTGCLTFNNLIKGES